MERRNISEFPTGIEPMASRAHGSPTLTSAQKSANKKNFFKMKNNYLWKNDGKSKKTHERLAWKWCDRWHTDRRDLCKWIYERSYIELRRKIWIYDWSSQLHTQRLKQLWNMNTLSSADGNRWLPGIKYEVSSTKWIKLSFRWQTICFG